MFGVDFNEMFTLVAKANTIQRFTWTTMDLEMHEMDVNTVYLNPGLEEEIYMDQLDGFFQP